MLVTITTDASYYHQHKIGGFAFWITSTLGRASLAGAFKANIESSHDAEFKSIINSLHYLKKLNWPITDLYINTDSMSVITAIETGGGKPQHAKDNLNSYQLILKELNNPRVSLRHVKGHLHTKTARHWVNSWCDKEAGKAARKKIKDLFGGFKN